MGIIKRLKWKDKTGKTTDYDLGAKASNVEQDATHRFVSDTEKQTWNGKADPEDIPSGSAADYGVANNDTTNRTDMLVTAQVAYQHGREIDQLNSDLGGLTFAQDAEGNWGYIPSGADAVIPFRKATKVLAMFHASTSGITRYTAEQKIFGLTMVTEDARESYTVLKVNGEDQTVKDIAQISSTYVSGYQTYDITLNPGDEVAVTNRGGGGSDIVLLSGIVQVAGQ